MKKHGRFVLMVGVVVAIVTGAWWVLWHGDAVAPSLSDPDEANTSEDSQTPSSLDPVPHEENLAATRLDNSPLGGLIASGGPSQGELSLPGIVTGIVETQDGAPVPGAAISLLQVTGENVLTPLESPLTRQATTDINGEFEFAGLPLGMYSVLAHIDERSQTGQAELVPERRYADLDLRLVPASVVAGRIQENDGTPVAGALICAFQVPGVSASLRLAWRVYPNDAGSEPIPLSAIVESDANGKFLFEGIPLVETSLFALPPARAPCVSPMFTPPCEEVKLVVSSGGTISGRVIDGEAEEPVGDTAVELMAPGYVERFRVTTRKDGTFESPPLRANHYRLLVNDGRYVLADSQALRIELGEAETKDDVILKVVSAGSISGYVRDEVTGRPLPDVYVRANGFGMLYPNSTTSGKDGSYRVTGVGTGEVWLTVEPGHMAEVSPQDSVAKVTVETDAGHHLTGIDLKLFLGTTLQGQVVDETGKPVRHAEVIVKDPRGTTVAIERTDPHGLFAVRGFQHGERVFVWARKDARITLAPVQVPIPEPGTSTPLTLTIRPGATIQGRVVHPTGAPAAEIPVHLRYSVSSHSAPELESSRKESKRDGSFCWEGLFPGSYNVAIQGENGWRPKQYSSAEIEVSAENPVASVDLWWYGKEPWSTLPKKEKPKGNCIISGLVTDSRGKPVPEASVAAKDLDGKDRSAKTKEDGTFRIAGLPPGSYKVTAYKFGFAMEEEVVVEASAHNVSLVLLAWPKINGQVLDARTGKPVTQFKLSQQMAVVLEKTAYLEGHRWSSFSDEEGRFSTGLRHIGEESVLLVQADGYAQAHIQLAEPALGATIDDLIFRLRPEAVVEGLVCDDAGKPVVGVGICVDGNTRSHPSARSDKEGKFRITGLPAGAFELTARHAAYAPLTITVNTSCGKTTPAEMVVRSGGTLEAYVLRNGQPLQGQSLMVDGTCSSDMGNTDAAGYYSFEHMCPGQASVMLVAEVTQSPVRQTLTARQTVTVSESQRSRVDFLFSSGVALEGMVTIGGTPASAGSITMKMDSQTTDFDAEAELAPNGAYRIENPWPGAATVKVRLDCDGDSREQEVRIEMPAGQIVRKDFEFAKAASIFGTVHGAFGDAHVSIVVYRGRIDRATIENANWQDLKEPRVDDTYPRRDGSFAFGGLEAGTYTVVVKVSESVRDWDGGNSIELGSDITTVDISPDHPAEIVLNP